MKKKLYITIILIAVISLSFYFGLQKVQADELDSFGTLISKQNISAITDNDYVLSKYRRDKETVWVLTKTGLWKNLNLELGGFEDLVELCRQNIYQIDDHGALCLKGFVGAHAENAVLIDLAKFQPIAFENEASKSYNIISDVPLFFFADDDAKLFISDMRNYDKNPLTDSIRGYYNWNGAEFIFDKQENITYDGKNIVTEGEL